MLRDNRAHSSHRCLENPRPERAELSLTEDVTSPFQAEPRHYPSVQGGKGNLNIVLFHKAARVQALDIPKGTEIHAQLYEQNEDGVEIYPWIWEEVPPMKTPPETASVQLEHEALLVSEVLDSPDPEDYDYERQEPVLKLDISNLQVYVVKGVEFQTESNSVYRHRSEKRESAF